MRLIDEVMSFIIFGFFLCFSVFIVLYSLIGWPYCHPSAAPRAVKHPTKQGIKYKQRQTIRKKLKGGSNKMQQRNIFPTLKYEWRNIPFYSEETEFGTISQQNTQPLKIRKVLFIDKVWTYHVLINWWTSKDL